jgi:hypothetical protein
MEQLEAAVKCVRKDVLYILKLDGFMDEDMSRVIKILQGKRFALEFPRILHGRGRAAFEKKWEKIRNVFETDVPEAVIVNSYRGLLYAGEHFEKNTWYADENFYTENRRAERVLKQLGMIPAQKRTYGRLAVMVTQGCLSATMGKCKSRERVYLEGPKGDEFVAVTQCECCYNTIYTKEPLRHPEGFVRIDFTWENAEEVREVIREWNL